MTFSTFAEVEVSTTIKADTDVSMLLNDLKIKTKWYILPVIYVMISCFNFI